MKNYFAVFGIMFPITNRISIADTLLLKTINNTVSLQLVKRSSMKIYYCDLGDRVLDPAQSLLIEFLISGTTSE